MKDAVYIQGVFHRKAGSWTCRLSTDFFLRFKLIKMEKFKLKFKGKSYYFLLFLKLSN